MPIFIMSILDSPSTASASLLSSAVQLIATLVWPTVLIAFLVTQRQVIGRLLTALALLAESANKIKIWQIEIERSIDQEVDRIAKESQGDLSVKQSVPKSDVIAATRVETLVRNLSDSQAGKSLLNSVRLRMVVLAEEYEKTRENMSRGRERTVAMNAIAAQMRALGKAAKQWLKEFSESDNSPGMRLCAIAILQVSPSASFISWLGGRFSSEEPFVFYQASIALMEAVKNLGRDHHANLGGVISASIAQLESYTEGPPDLSSINILNAALKRLRAEQSEVLVRKSN